jgi:hypothetical protein
MRGVLVPVLSQFSSAPRVEWWEGLAKGAAMFVFNRSIFAPLAALAVSALFVMLDALLRVGTP